MWFYLKLEFRAFLGFRAKIGISGARRHLKSPKSALKSIKMREIPIFAKSQYLENHMGRAQSNAWYISSLSIRSKVKPDFRETIIYLHSPFFSIAIYFEVNGNGRKHRDKKWCGSTKDSHIMIYFVKKPFDILVCHCFRH